MNITVLLGGGRGAFISNCHYDHLSPCYTAQSYTVHFEVLILHRNTFFFLCSRKGQYIVVPWSVRPSEALSPQPLDQLDKTSYMNSVGYALFQDLQFDAVIEKGDLLQNSHYWLTEQCAQVELLLSIVGWHPSVNNFLKNQLL